MSRQTQRMMKMLWTIHGKETSICEVAYLDRTTIIDSL